MIPLLLIHITSHERPNFLAQMLLSLSPLFNRMDTTIAVSDNSVINRLKISEVCSRFPSVKLHQSPGATVYENFKGFTRFSKHKYLWLLHDDDVILIRSLHSFIAALVRSDASLLYVSCCDVQASYPFKLATNKHHLAKSSQSLHDLVFPRMLPAFPSYIYKMDSRFINLFMGIQAQSVFGKYQDTGFIMSFAEDSYVPLPSINSVILIHRWHNGSDSAVYDGRAYRALLSYSLPKMTTLTSQINSILLFLIEEIKQGIKAMYLRLLP
jgi:hypothetical protein